MKKVLISIFAFLLMAFLVISVSSCRKNTEPQPDEDTEIPNIPDDPDEDEGNALEDDPEQVDETEAAAAKQAAAIPSQNALIIRFTASNPCIADKALKVYFQESNQLSSLPITDAQRLAQKGIWKSFSVKPEKFGRLLGKTFDRTKSYAFYTYDSAEKKMYPALLIGAYPAEIVVQEVPNRKAYSTAIVPISCNK